MNQTQIWCFSKIVVNMITQLTINSYIESRTHALHTTLKICTFYKDLDQLLSVKLKSQMEEDSKATLYDFILSCLFVCFTDSIFLVLR